MERLIAHFGMLAHYNSGANARLYAACDGLSDEELWHDRRAFFKSIMGTLNHLVVGDRVWLARFEGGESPSTHLDAIVCDNLADLWAVRQAEDRRIERLAGSLDAGFLSGTIAYVNNEGRRFVDPVAMLLTHFFNHQTHHRGQVHAMLTQTDAVPPVLDMHRVLKPDPDSVLV
jgi:uncharacterized damage-inducible protein DinB